LDVNLELDSLIANPILKRMNFAEKVSAIETIKINSLGTSDHCFDYLVSINVSYFQTGALEIAARVSLSYELSSAFKATILSGILDPMKAKKVTTDFTFEKGCSGSNGRCRHDISASASFSISSSASPLVLGPQPGVLTVTITIENHGPDNSFFTRFNISSGDLAFSKASGVCIRTVSSDVTSGILVLSYVRNAAVLGDMMLANTSCQFSVEFDLDSLTSKATSREIQLSGIAYSNAGGPSVAFDPNTENNKIRFSRSVRYSALLSSSGISHPGLLFYTRLTNPKVVYSLNDPVLGGNLTNIIHTHTLANAGTLSATSLPMNLVWPEATKGGLPLLYIYDLKCEPASKCQCEIGNKVNSMNLQLTAGRQSTPTPLRFPTTPSNFPAVVSCNDVICRSISCTVSRLDPFFSINLIASFKLWLPTLNQERLSTELRSTLEVKVQDRPIHPSINLKSTVATQVSVKLPAITTSGGINLGAIIGGIVGGLALMGIIIAVMWKAGFFKSKYGDMKRDA
uniref:Integrin alpha third immunoglobulin-like domain-containing protein n=1 Tax=Ciona savignyi TaxID=51511 RepID=H2YQU9_CIOSA